MTTRPTGTVSFLFTDIEGSTALAQEYPGAMAALLRRHHQILQQAIEAQHGHVFQIIGDAFCAAFPTAREALEAALAAQRALVEEDWGPAPVKVRMGLHTGAAEAQSAEEGGGYSGYLTLTRVQRVMSVAHGGQILLSQATAGLVRGELSGDLSLRDLGEQRLKGLASPDHLWQVEAAGLPRDFPPLRSLHVTPHNLPVQLTSFIGREHELAEVRQALAQHRLVTLTGSGGAGKSRLSLQVAAGELERFQDGVWLVELASLREPGLIPQTILSAANVRLQQGVTDWQNLVDFLREKSCLLVLDNCEHLIEDCARVAQDLLQEAPRLKVLASSREALGVRGEQAWRVPSLSVPDARHLPPVEQLSRYEAVCLFTERACLVQPHFRVTSENAAAVAEVCQRLDGIPLAIELAAARLRSLGVEKIAARLDDRFHLLTGGARTALPRQQTLRALIDWSYDLLTEKERTLLRRLAVFSGGWSLEAAEQVCGEVPLESGEILDMLEHLVDKSMVALKEGQEARYSLLETIRQYARDKLAECGESASSRDRHLAYFVAWVTALEPSLRGPQQVELLNQVENELDNLRAAMEWSRGSDPAAGLLLAARLKWFWHMNGAYEEGAGWLESLLASAESSSIEMDPLRKAEALSVYSWLAYWTGQARTRSAASLQDSIALVENEPGSLAARIRADNLYNSGILAIAGGDPSRGTLLGRQCLEAYEACGSPFGMAEACLVLYSSASNAGDLETARYWNETGIGLRRKLGDKDGLAFDLTMGAMISFFLADYEGAKQMLAEAMQASQEMRYHYSLGLALCVRGMISLLEDEPGQALDYFSQHAALAGETSDAMLKIFTIYYLAWLLLKLRQYRLAVQLTGACEASNRYHTVTIYETPLAREVLQHHRQEARLALGEAEYNAAYAGGRLFSLDQAMVAGLQQAEAALQP